MSTLPRIFLIATSDPGIDPTPYRTVGPLASPAYLSELNAESSIQLALNDLSDKHSEIADRGLTVDQGVTILPLALASGECQYCKITRKE
jgi:hypothetical protein